MKNIRSCSSWSSSLCGRRSVYNISCSFRPASCLSFYTERLSWPSQSPGPRAPTNRTKYRRHTSTSSPEILRRRHLLSIIISPSSPPSACARLRPSSSPPISRLTPDTEPSDHHRSCAIFRLLSTPSFVYPRYPPLSAPRVCALTFYPYSWHFRCYWTWNLVISGGEGILATDRVDAIAKITSNGRIVLLFVLLSRFAFRYTPCERMGNDKNG